MGKKYKYVYAEVLTGQLHLVEPTLPPEDLSKIKWEQQY